MAYLKFLKNKQCNRTNEINILKTKYGVTKMPAVIFPIITNENLSVYEIITEQEDKLHEYFDKNESVQEITQEQIDKWMDLSYYQTLENGELTQSLMKRK